MSIKDSIDVNVDLLGGLVLDVNATDLPPGVSPDCQDLIFSESRPRTRPGLGSPLFPALGTRRVNYLKTYITLDQQLRALVVDSAGNLYRELPLGTLDPISAALPANSRPNSVTLFGREYLAVGDGRAGTDLPRQYDDANFDRVSQVGPGAPPVPSEDSTAVAIAASPTGIVQPAAVTVAAASEVGFTVTVTTSTPHGLGFGDVFTAAGVGSGYDGTWTVASILSPTQFTYLAGFDSLLPVAAGTIAAARATVHTSTPHGFAVGQSATIVGDPVTAYDGSFPILAVPDSTHFTFVAPSGGLGASGGGTVFAGSISPGVHQVACVFLTRQGYLTAPSPPAKWTASGLRRVALSSIPIGPANVIARILCFTAAGGASFFYLGDPSSPSGTSAMVIPNNTATTAVVDFDDTALLSSTNVDSLFNLLELGECSNVISYANRLFWVGERTKLSNFLNLTFDGGFSPPVALGGGRFSGPVPLGWTVDPLLGEGGGEDVAGVWLSAYRITGNGTAAARGFLSQSAYQDWEHVAIIQPHTAYSLRVRVRKGGGLAAGTLHVRLASASAPLTTPGLALTAAAAPAAFAEFIVPIAEKLATVPSDLQLQVYADGTPTNGGYFVLDCLEIYPTEQPVATSRARASRADDPESYDGETGAQAVNEDDGYSLRAMFKLRDNRLYYLKEQGLYATQDDQANEPDQWDIDTVSSKIGTPSTRGAGLGEDWAVIVSRSGLYLFWGPEPVKISPEIQPLWDRINWAVGHTCWVVVDPQERRIRIGVPLDQAQEPNTVLYLDYRDLDSASEIANSPPVHIGYSGRKVAKDRARKWSPWSIAANCCALIERPDGTRQVWYGNGAGNGAIYAQLDTPAVYHDDGAAIHSYYETYFLPAIDQEQQLQLRSHRKLYAYLTVFVEGKGKLWLRARSPGGAYLYPLPYIQLRFPNFRDSELITNLQAERLSYRIETNAPGSWFQLSRFCPTLLPDPAAPIRGF